MGLDFRYQEGQTPINPSEMEGLKIGSITLQSELNEWEQLNIERAVLWLSSKQFPEDTILSEKFIKDLHKKMFGDVWNWAGTFRKSDKNIGVSWYEIPSYIKPLLDDVRFWIKNGTYPPDEIALRFKHRIVSIHCFPNGNGRHARLFADTLIEKVFQRQSFSWYQGSTMKPEIIRNLYISALKEADKGNIDPLLKFARS